MIFLPGFLVKTEYQEMVSFILNSFTVILCIITIQETKFQLYTGIFIALFILIVNQLGVFNAYAQIDFYMSFIIYILFYIFVVYKLIAMIFKTNNVGLGVLLAAIIVYLLIGVIGGYLFMLIENAWYGSLINLTVENLKAPSEFFYFSFCTLTTVGYGDIYPYSPPAQSLAMLLSIIGPLYLTILVALLVSRFSHESSSRRDIH